MARFTDYIVLPKTITDFEAKYVQKVNRIALGFFAAHVPALALLAWVNGTKPWLAVLLSLVGLVGPVLAQSAFRNPRSVSVVFGVVAMYFGGLLVHFGQGPMQIEMHFYFFALLAMLSVFGNPMVIIAGTVTVALHHLVLWFLVPQSVFNYAAPVWVVGVHAAFVVLESVAVCYIARNFFDNVIGLEKIVRARTTELDERNHDLRRVLDNVAQGFVTVNAQGLLSTERSLTFDRWFGTGHATMFDAFRGRSAAFSNALEISWEALADGVLPAELLIDQLPTRLTHGDEHFSISFLPIGGEGSEGHYLVVVTDVTAAVNREKSERQRLEILHLFERAVADRPALEDYLREASSLVADIARPDSSDVVTFKRKLHTLKGNSAILGLSSVADMCHDLETRISSSAAPPSEEAVAPLADCWSSLTSGMNKVFGASKRTIELDPAEHAVLEREAGRVSLELWRLVHRLRLEPVKRRMERFADHATYLADRLGKEINVEVRDNGIRLDADQWSPFWGAFLHAVRNAVDHGVESPSDREDAGKSRAGTLTITTEVEGGAFVVEVRDDGRGVAWERIREKAIAHGLPAVTDEDLARAMCFDGLSTAERVTDISGRGVGLGALEAAAKVLNGEITIESKAGLGTTLRIRFPMNKMEEERPDPVRRTLPPRAA